MFMPSASPQKLTNLQQELLKLYSFNLPEKDLLEIKDMVGKYLIDKLIKKVGDSENNNIIHQ